MQLFGLIAAVPVVRGALAEVVVVLVLWLRVPLVLVESCLCTLGILGSACIHSLLLP